MATRFDFTGTIKGNEKNATDAKNVIEKAMWGAANGELGDHAPAGILYEILQALEIKWECTEVVAVEVGRN